MNGLFGTSFVIQEFVPPETYKKWGRKSVWFINKRVVLFCQWLKDYTGESVTINDWHWGGQYQYSGYRPPDCTVGAGESSHRRSIGIDIKVQDYGAEEVRQIIRDKFKYLNELFGVSCIELGTETWTHVDFRETGMNSLIEIPIPKTD